MNEMLIRLECLFWNSAMILPFVALFWTMAFPPGVKVPFSSR